MIYAILVLNVVMLLTQSLIGILAYQMFQNLFQRHHNHQMSVCNIILYTCSFYFFLYYSQIHRNLKFYIYQIYTLISGIYQDLMQNVASHYVVEKTAHLLLILPGLDIGVIIETVIYLYGLYKICLNTLL
jgi:hypothetical protein